MTLFTRILLVLLALQTFTFQTYAKCPDDIFEGSSGKPSGSLKDDLLKTSKEEVTNYGDNDLIGKPLLANRKEVFENFVQTIARDGFEIDDVALAIERAKALDPAVSKKLLNGYSFDDLETLLQKFVGTGPKNAAQWTAAIRKADKNADAFDLPLLFALISGQGAVVERFAEGAYAYHSGYLAKKVAKRADGKYKPGESDKADRSGRSYSSMIVKKGNRTVFDSRPIDVSDRKHLATVQELAQKDPEQYANMLRAIIMIKGNSDFSLYAELDPEFQSLLTDYLAVDGAEEFRNFMLPAYKINFWGAALFEVTLDGIMWANVKNFVVPYSSEFLGIPLSVTDEIYGAYPNKSDIKTTSDDVLVTFRPVEADYSAMWKRSQQFDPDSKDLEGTRSGINLTRKEFTLTGQFQTAWVAKKKPELVKNIAKILKSPGKSVSRELSLFFFNDKNVKPAAKMTAELADAVVAYYLYVAENGPKILEAMAAEYPKSDKIGKPIVISKKAKQAEQKKKWNK